MQEATRAYQAESDPMAEFIAACFVRDAGGKVRVHDAYKLLVAFAMEQQNRKLERESETTFGRQFSARFAKKHFRTGWFYMGLSVRKSWFHWLDAGSPSTVADDSAEHAA